MFLSFILSYWCLLNLATKHMLHKLCAIAKTKYRYTKFEKFFSTCWRAIFITAVRTTRKDNSFRVHGLNLRQVCLVRIDLTIYITFTDSSCNELIILSAEVSTIIFS